MQHDGILIKDTMNKTLSKTENSSFVLKAVL
jgi:hypothetical protein